ncbi:MAG: helix-turn-helix domain-containing protein [Micromonosporaceae bacterium]|nr:helix-turn-helix domain-containing protein [Micromonosporaceae bacterium]
MSARTDLKVTDAHLARTAYLYVRQSTLRQVLTNTESATRQHALRQRAIALGWPAEQIIAIDTDQGQSGASAADREGFQRLVAEVGMGRAGIVLGLEVSRLARNNADWHRLLEICALSGTLICDEDGLYDPGEFNDRLLLGLKGTMSEAELHFIRARLIGGPLSKARRGELQIGLPVGLVYDGAGNVVLDPDTSVQDAIRHVFALFARTGSARAVVAEFNAAGLFPVRVRTGAHKGELAWMPLQHWRVLRTPHNPRYAGAFAYGRRRERINGNGKKTFQTLPRDQWIALIPNAHPGYIDWEQHETNQRLLLANATAHGSDRAAGPAREGPALLQGLAICGRCGRRMTVRYHTRRGVEIPDYQCMHKAIQDSGRRCQAVPGAGVDTAVGQLLLDTLTPLALEVALTVQTELETRAAEADALRRQHVQRARHRADLARRRYLSVDPETRLVADSLEAGWNDALRALHAAQDDYDKASAAAAAGLTDEHKARIHALAADFPALWSNPDTPQRERKRMVRLLVEDVTLIKTDRIHLHMRLRGGQTESLTVPIPPKAWQARQTHPDTLAALDRLLDEHTDAETAERLNAAGHRSGEGKPFTPRIVLDLRDSNNLHSHADRLRAKGLLTMAEIAERLGVHPTTIKNWRRAGLLPSHKANDKNERLFEPPTPGDPRLAAQQGSPIKKRVHTRSAPGGAL